MPLSTISPPYSPQLDEDRALQLMVRVSSHSNVKLRDIAQELVDQGNDRRPATS